MAGYIHDDVQDIMEHASRQPKNIPSKKSLPSTVGWTEEQLQALDEMLQYSWNRGYKSATKDLEE